MATGHEFGGDWTDTKLKCLEGYLRAYRSIFSANKKAKYFRTWYVDAFAGTGERTAKIETGSSGGLFDEFYDETHETARYRKGSADIALSLDSPFDSYLFIDKSASHADRLRSLISTKHAQMAQRVKCIVGDANALLASWVAERDWKKERAVVFLDPYGLQVKWETVQLLGQTKGVDLWYLFPVGMGPMRMIPRDGIVPEPWSEKLDELFGTHEWKNRFFRQSSQQSLFGEAPQEENAISIELASAFVKERLGLCFHKVADGMILRNSKSFPMYLLCFAASNERGAGPALRIANSILGIGK